MAKKKKVILTAADKKAIVGYMTDYELIWDDFYFNLVDNNRILDDCEQEEEIEEYHKLVKKFILECRRKLREVPSE